MNPSHPNYPHPTSELITKIMKSNKGFDTKPEIALRSLLFRLGLRFRKDYIIHINNKKIKADIVFTKKKLVVFLDGCFWHLCPIHGHIPQSNIDYWETKLKKNKERDLKTKKYLRKHGWTVIRIWEHVPLQKATEIILRKINNDS